MQFLNYDVWKIQLDTLSPFKAFLVRMLRIILLTKKVFTTNQIEEGACTLTYYSLLAFVPIIILLLGLAKGFMLEQTIINLLIERFSNQKEMILEVIKLAENALHEINKGIVAGVGVIILLWSAIKILQHLEVSLNTIWEVKKKRTLLRQFTDYLALLLMSPLLFLVANGVIFYLSSKVMGITAKVDIEGVEPVIFVLLNLLPLALMGGLFTFIILFMPNTKVEIKPALIGGMIAGLLYQAVQWVYLVFQVGVTNYNPLYGTFAAIPFFIVWVHLSWLILLLGAKLSFAIQNVDAYEFVNEEFKLSRRAEELLALQVSHTCVHKLSQSAPPPTPTQISVELAIPLFVLRQILIMLKEANVLAEVKRDEEQEGGFIPAQPIEQLTIKRILDMINQKGDSIPLQNSAAQIALTRHLQAFDKLIEKAPANVALVDI